MSLTKERIQEIKSYVVESLIEDFEYDENKAIELVDTSIFPILLERNPEYVLHYDFQYWAEYVIKN